MKYIKKWTDQRINNAHYYDSLFKQVDYVTSPEKYKDSKHVYHLYVVKCNKRDLLMKYLEKKVFQLLFIIQYLYIFRSL